MCAYGYDLLRRTITLSHCSCFSVCYVWFTLQQIAPFTMGLKAHTRHTHTHTHTHTQPAFSLFSLSHFCSLPLSFLPCLSVSIFLSSPTVPLTPPSPLPPDT